jgi:hypothetical protein
MISWAARGLRPIPGSAGPWRVVSVETVPAPQVIEPASVNLTASRHVR